MVAAPRGRSPQFLRRVHNRPALRRRSSLAVFLQLLLVTSGLAVGGGLAWGVYHWVHHNETFRLRRLMLEQVPAELQAVVRTRLDRARNANLLLLDVGSLQARLESIPQVQTARIRRVLPDAVEVEVVPRSPWGVLDAEDVRVLVSRDGTVLGPAQGAQGSLPRLVLAAPIADRLGDRSRLPQGVTGVAAFDDAVRTQEWVAAHGPFAFGHVGYYRLDEIGVVLVLADHPWEIGLGDSTDLQAKVDDLRALLAEDPPQGPSFVDLRYRDMVVVRDLEAPPSSDRE